jgi:hypothetical protein
MSSEVGSGLVAWRWATEGGEPEQGTEQELVLGLATGQVPPYALVWRAGWGEWLPAMQVPELAAAFPVQGAAPRSARPSTVPGVPPVPVSEYPRLRLLAKQTPLGILSEYDCPEREVVTSEVPIAAMLEAARVMTEPTPPPNLGLELAVGRGNQRPADFSDPDLTPSGQRMLPPPSGRALPLAEEFGLQALLDTTTVKSSSWALWLRAHGVWIAVLALSLGLAALFGARWFAASARRVPPPPTATRAITHLEPQPVSVAPAAPRELPVPACRFRHEPVKLDDWAIVDVRPTLLALPRDQSLALGYAQSHEQATGGVLDLDSLEMERQFGQQQERQIFSVTPLRASGTLSYHVERMGALVAFGRALDTVPPVRIGMNDDGLVVGRLDQRSEKLWALPFGSVISVPEIAAHAEGFTLATRVGRGTGQLRLGLLSLVGAPRSALQQVGNPALEYGRPALASGPKQTVLAVSVRAEGAPGYSLQLARAKNGELPLELQSLEGFDSLEMELSAPALAALPDGGFVLMWSQGEGWRRQVRLQRLSSTLAPLGASFDVTAPEPARGGASAGAIQWVADRLIALYFVRRGEGHSLWAGSVSCGV